MKAGVIVEDWKLPTFRKHLDAAGYKYEVFKEWLSDQPKGTVLIRVEYSMVSELKPIVEAAQEECSKSKRT